MNRPLVAAMLLALAACGPYRYVRKAEPNPMAGQKVIMMSSLLFGSAEVDGMPESAWIMGQNDGWKQEWPADQLRAAGEFARELKAKLAARGIKANPQANPEGATLTLRPSVTSLKTGGWRPTILEVSVQLVDASGAPVEEISTKVKVDSTFNKFEDRLDQAALLTAGIVADWLAARSTEG